MNRGKLLVRIVVVTALAAAGFAAPLAHADPTEPNGGDLVEECATGTGSPMCRQFEQLTRDFAQVCRFARADAETGEVGTPEAACSAIDGREYSEAAVAEFEASSLGRALRLQERLDDALPLGEALIPATHNSFNSAAYYPTVSGLDHNQVATLTDQLRMGMRSLELDVHWFPSPYGDPADGGYAPILCHGTVPPQAPVPIHVGCTGERHLREGLAEIATWLDAHPDEFLLLYLENALDGIPAAHATAAETIETELGSLVYPTATGACDSMPTDLSEADVLAANDGDAQVLIVGNAAPEDEGPWCGLVHDRYDGPFQWHESKSDVGDDFDCSTDRPASGYGSVFRRFYEDSTWIGATLEPTGQASPGELTVADTAAMVACGVNLFGFDQLVPGDPRLGALVWSWDWEANQPSTGDFAFRDADGRFHSTPDTTGARPFACADDATGAWSVTSTEGAWSDGHDACPEGTSFSVPHTGYENSLLPTGTAVWVNYATVDGEWTSDLAPAGGGSSAPGRAGGTPATDHLPPAVRF